MRNALSPGAALLLALPLLSVAGCGDAGSRSGQASDGALFALGPGSSWSLMSVPRDGGRPRMAGLSSSTRRTTTTDPAGGAAEEAASWTGSEALPPAARVHRLGDQYLALLTPDGRALRYDPVRDVASEAGRIAPGAAWSAHGQWGVFRDTTASGELLQIAPGGAWRYRPEPPASWASPARDGSVVAILTGGGEAPGGVVRYDRGGDRPAARAPGEFAPVAAVTGFGGQVATVRRGEDGWSLALLALPELESGDRTELPGAPDALAASPSDHELYVAVGDRVLVYGRPSLNLRAERSLPARAMEIRPGLLGGPLMVRTADGVSLLPWDEEGSVAVETGWRSDLPVALPDGSALVVRSGRVLRIGREGEELGSPGPADRWWVPIRWRVPDEVPRVASGTAVAGGDRPTDPGAGRDEAGPPGGAPDSAAAGGSATDPADAAGSAAPEAGFYAVVAAARSRDGIRRLLTDLGAGGWTTAIQEWKDDAGRVWYRGLVGPYGTRPAAEDAARRLQREEDLSVWVKELGPGISGWP